MLQMLLRAFNREGALMHISHCRQKTTHNLYLLFRASLLRVWIVATVNTNVKATFINNINNGSNLTVDTCLHRHVCVIWQSLLPPLTLNLSQRQVYLHSSLASDWLVPGQLTPVVYGSSIKCSVRNSARFGWRFKNSAQSPFRGYFFLLVNADIHLYFTLINLRNTSIIQ